ncbi:MAG TPA: hypothetical protein VF791_18680 [Pyrinomonadaceae bacterium]
MLKVIGKGSTDKETISEVNRVTSASENSKVELSEKIILTLLDKATEEITSYRQRQINTFREAVIVQAVITWGVSRLILQPNFAGWLIRGVAGFACICASVIGWLIIMSYKKRIYYIRDKRQALIERVHLIATGNIEPVSLFYPTKADSLPDEYRTKLATSSIYGFTLLILGGLTAVVNIFAGLAMP